MGASDLQTAFNAVGGAAFTCQRATLHYERHDNLEWQILTFHGTAADGTPFSVVSDHIAGGIDPNTEAGAVAQRLIDQRKPANENLPTI